VGLGILVYLRKLIIGLREWQGSVFGLERRIAQRKLISASTALVLLLFLFIGEFLLVTIIEPQMPLPSSDIPPATASTAPTTEPQLQDEVSDADLPPDELIRNNSAAAAAEVFLDGGEIISECIEDVLEITNPTNGETIGGTVEIMGSVNVDNFGSYKYEYSPTGTIDWVTIAAGNQLKLDENIGFWYTSALPPGPYLLRLVPLNNLGEELTPCVVAVEVRQVEEE
jgi:hypothetical protein